MRVKQNQPHLLQALKDWFQRPKPWTMRQTPYDSQEVYGHGRRVRYTIWTTAALNSYLQEELAWPAVGQVFCIERHSTDTKTGEVSLTYHYGITSLEPDEAAPAEVLCLWRHHWHIENKLHWVRDVVFGEDGSRARTATLPLALALLRNALITLLKFAGYDSVTQARAYFSANPQQALSFVGVPLE